MMKRSYARMLLACVLTFAMMTAGIGEVAAAAVRPRINKKKAVIRVGDTVKLKVLHGKKKVTWSSNKKKVASVSKSGLVKGRKKGTATITAKTGGKKCTCKVTVKAGNAPGPQTDAPGGTPRPSFGPTGRPGGTTPAPSASSSQPPSNTPGSTPALTPSHTPSSTASAHPDYPIEPQSPSGGPASSQQVPPASAADTLTVGNMSVTLGMTRAQVEDSVGAAPDRSEKTPLGFDAYIYNPSGDYTNYLMVQFDNDSVVAMSTISAYFTYEDMLTSGQQTASDLTGNGFSSMRSRYDYEAGYLYTGDKEYVLAFVDHQGSQAVYGAEILARQTGISDGETSLDDLFKAENGSYDQTVNAAMARELFDWACAFRTVKGLPVFTAYDSAAAQLHSEDMAANGFVGVDSSDGTKRADRFEEAYPGYIGSAECNASRSPDAFGAVTWLVDDTDSGCYPILTRSADNSGIELAEYYLCTGFASNPEQKDITYAALDLFYY